MQQLIAALKSGNYRSLLACFLYFDSGFSVWVILGALSPLIARQLSLPPAQSAFLVAVPVLVASIARITLGNLFQSVSGRPLALLGIALSAVPAVVLLLPIAASYTLLLVLGVFLGVGGASFAVALPMAGSSYPPRLQGLVLGLAAAGNIGAVLDGLLFPALAEHIGWRHATAALLPLLALAALAVLLWAEDRSEKAPGAARALAGFAGSLALMVALVLAQNRGLLGRGNAGRLVLPLLGLALPIALLSRRYLAALGERDTWVIMLIYGITFGGFVGMTSYVSLLLTAQYGLPRLEAGYVMALLSCLGALVRPVGGFIADRLSGVRVLVIVLAAISLGNFAFALLMPPLAGGLALLLVLYLCFGVGNGATFQLVPQRWRGATGVMTGIVGAAGGIGGFYLPVVMGMARQATGSYQLGFVTFGALAAFALLLVSSLQQRWLAWAATA